MTGFMRTFRRRSFRPRLIWRQVLVCSRFLRLEVSLPRTATFSSDLLAREVFVRPLDDEVADLSGKCGFLLPVTLPPPFTRLKATIVR